jgi:tetratricopeptide (TPR) repeat protein
MDLFEQRKYNAAIIEFEKENNSASEINIATCQFELEMHRKCVSTCSSILSKDKYNVTAYLLMGKSLLELKQIRDARKAFENAIDACRRTQNSFMFLVAKDHLAILNDDKDNTANVLIDLECIRKRYIGSAKGLIGSEIFKEARKTLINATGEDIVDDLIAFGYLQVVCILIPMSFLH